MNENKDYGINELQKNYEDKNTSKKLLVSAIVAVVTLIALTAGATYAYFQVTISGSVTNSTLTATTGAVSSVALSGGSKTITMNITAAQMMAGASDVTYYAPATGSAATTAVTSVEVGKATQTGAGNNSCSYTINVTPTTNDLWTAFNTMVGKAAGQIILTVGNQTFDFASTTFAASTAVPKTGNFTTTGAGSTSINAQLKFVNSKTINQNALAGKTQAFTINISGLTCTTTS